MNCSQPSLVTCLQYLRSIWQIFPQRLKKDRHWSVTLLQSTGKRKQCEVEGAWSPKVPPKPRSSVIEKRDWTRAYCSPWCPKENDLLESSLQRGPGFIYQLERKVNICLKSTDCSKWNHLESSTFVCIWSHVNRSPVCCVKTGSQIC